MERIRASFNSLHAGLFFLLLLSSADFFSEVTFPKNSIRNTIKMSNGLDPDPDQFSVAPTFCQFYLGISCLQRLSADVKRWHQGCD